MAENSEKKGKFSLKRIAARIGRFFKDIKGEVKKIVWPTSKQVVNGTIVVIVMVLVVGLFIWGLDSILTFCVNAFLKAS